MNVKKRVKKTILVLKKLYRYGLCHKIGGGVIERVGSEYGHFYIDSNLIKKKSVVYSCGIGEDISFDIEMVQKYNVNVYGFDPTPKSIDWLEHQSLPEQFSFFPYGISDKNESVDFYLPSNDNYVSGSIVKHEGQGEKITVEMRRVSTIMKELGHNRIDILKMDIEGSEFKVIADVLGEGINVIQICMEIHERFFNDGRKRFMKMKRELFNKGYRMQYVSDDGLVLFTKL